MNNIHAILIELRDYCDKTGLSPATVCNRATNNARLHKRLEARAVKVDEDIKALRDFMAANPPASEARQ